MKSLLTGTMQTVMAGLLASWAMAADRPKPPAPVWVAQARLQVDGEPGDGESQPAYVGFLVMANAGKATTLDETASTSSSVRITVTPAQARVIADALTAWLDNPTNATTIALVVR
jgi:hypothetical protein